MKRRELRHEIWLAVKPVLHEYRSKNRCSHHKAVQVVTAEVRNVFPLFRGVSKQKQKPVKLLTKSEWKPESKPRFSLRAIWGFICKGRG